MKKLTRQLAAVATLAAAALLIPSCAYDPYYSSTSVGGSYSSGYGDGYGYGGSNFNTSVFVSTGNPRWGYDPYCYSYYDYNRRAYYDPYMYGYYPVGYRPPVVVGCPHPYGYSAGRRYCPPPRVVRNTTMPNYRNRVTAYQGSSYGWAKQVRQQPLSQGRVKGQRPSSNTYSQSNSQSRQSQGSYGNARQNSRPPSGSYNRSSSQSRPSSGGNYSRQPQSRGTGAQNQGTRAGNQQKQSRLPQNYNTPVNSSGSRQTKYSPQKSKANTQVRPQGRQGNARQSQPAIKRNGSGSSGRQQQSRPSSDNKKRGIRSLGEG